MGEKLGLIRGLLYGALAVIILLSGVAVATAPHEAHNQIAKGTDRPSSSAKRSSGPNEIETETDTKYDRAQPHGSIDNPVIIKVLPEKKSEAEAKKDEYERQEKPELDRGLTAYTRLLAFFTIVLSVAAVVQVGLFWWQLHLIRKSLADGKVTAESAKASAEIAKETFTISHRAYLHIRSTQWHFDTNGYELEMQFQNFGQTPAHNVRNFPDLTLIDKGIRLTEEGKYGVRTYGTIGPGMASATILRLNQAISPVRRARMIADKARIYASGKLIYEDAFGKEWETNYKFMLWGKLSEANEGTMIVCPDGNTAT